MSATTTHDLGLTLADLEGMPDDGRRYELLGGAIVTTPAPTTVHQRVARTLLRLLDDACPPDLRLVGEHYEPYAGGKAISVEWPLVVEADVGRLASV